MRPPFPQASCRFAWRAPAQSAQPPAHPCSPARSTASTAIDPHQSSTMHHRPALPPPPFAATPTTLTLTTARWRGCRSTASTTWGTRSLSERRWRGGAAPPAHHGGAAAAAAVQRGSAAAATHSTAWRRRRMRARQARRGPRPHAAAVAPASAALALFPDWQPTNLSPLACACVQVQLRRAFAGV